MTRSPPTSLLKADELKDIIPHLNTVDIAGGSFGSRAGYLDPYGVLQGFIRKGKHLGVDYLYEEVTGIEVTGNAIEGIVTDKGSSIRCRIVVNGAVGFSGHGLQQSPAVGKCLSELLQFGEYRTIDLSRFSLDRFSTGKLVFEDAII